METAPPNAPAPLARRAPKRAREPLMKQAVRRFFRRVVSLYFRAVDVGGAVPDPNVGGRIFCGNHHNGLVDPLLVITAIGCPVSPIAKSTLWKIPGLRQLLEVAEAVAVARKQDSEDGTIDNDAMFDAVAEHLQNGGNLLIFPEGISHNDPHIAKLKTGAARMLVRAAGAQRRDAKDGPSVGSRHANSVQPALTYQAVAVDFDARDTFRSRAFLLFGPPRTVDPSAQDDQAVAAITAQIKADLDALYLDAPTWDERRLLLQVAELYAEGPPGEEVPLGDLVPIAKQVAAARDALSGGALAESQRQVQELRNEVQAYRDALDAVHLRDSDVRHGQSRKLAFSTTIVELFLAPFALAASVLYLLPYPLPRLVARWTKGTDDVKSTYKLGVGLVIYPLWALFLTIVATRLFDGVFLALAIAIVLFSPFAALRWIDRADAHGGGLLPMVNRDEMDALRTRRAALLAQLEAARTHTAAEESGQELRVTA